VQDIVIVFWQFNSGEDHSISPRTVTYAIGGCARGGTIAPWDVQNAAARVVVYGSHEEGERPGRVAELQYGSEPTIQSTTRARVEVS